MTSASTTAPPELSSWQQLKALSMADVGAIGAIALIYLGQRIGNMLILTVVPTIYHEAGVKLSDIWLFGLIGLPIWVKWLWAPVIDRFFSTRLGRRKSWMLPMSFLTAALLLPLLFVKPSADSVVLAVLVLVVWNGDAGHCRGRIHDRTA
jgi:hypothetical protein